MIRCATLVGLVSTLIVCIAFLISSAPAHAEGPPQTGSNRCPSPCDIICGGGKGCTCTKVAGIDTCEQNTRFDYPEGDL